MELLFGIVAFVAGMAQMPWDAVKHRVAEQSERFNNLKRISIQHQKKSTSFFHIGLLPSCAPEVSEFKSAQKTIRVKLPQSKM